MTKAKNFAATLAADLASVGVALSGRNVRTMERAFERFEWHVAAACNAPVSVPIHHLPAVEVSP